LSKKKLILPRRKLLVLAAPAIITSPRIADAMMMGIIGGNSVPPGPAWTLLSHGFAQTTTNSTPNPLTLTIDTTGANLLSFTNGFYSSITGTTTPSDSKGNTWFSAQDGPPLANEYAGTGIFIMQCYAYPGAKVGSGHVFSISWTASSAYAVIMVKAFKSGSGTPAFDTGGGSGFGFNQGGGLSGATAIDNCPINPPHANDLVIFNAIHNISGTPTITATSGFTISDTIPIISTVSLGGVGSWGIFPTGAISPTFNSSVALNADGASNSVYCFHS